MEKIHPEKVSAAREPSEPAKVFGKYVCISLGNEISLMTFLWPLIRIYFPAVSLANFKPFANG